MRTIATTKNPPTREDDERVLSWLRLADAGASFREISEMFGVTRNSVAGAIRRVREETRS